MKETLFECYKEVMNAPFKPEIVEPILARSCVSISGLKKNPAAVVAAARLQEVAILNRNRPVAYVISPEAWEHICDVFEDRADAHEVQERLAEGGEIIEVTLQQLSTGFLGQSGQGMDKARSDSSKPVRT